MKAALIDRYGSNDAVSVADIDIPILGPFRSPPKSQSVRGLARLAAAAATDRESRTLPAHASHRRVPAL